MSGVLILLIAGLFLIYKFAARKGVIRRWEDFVHDKFVKSGACEEGPTKNLLHLVEGYGLVRTTTTKNSPFAGKTLGSERIIPKEKTACFRNREGQGLDFSAFLQRIGAGR